MFGILLFVSENNEEKSNFIKLCHSCMGSLDDDRVNKL